MANAASAIVPIALAIACGALWVVVAAQDLATRRVSRIALVALVILALVGRVWFWWLAAALALACPRRYAGYLVALAVAIGLVSKQIAPAAALGVGAFVWALGGWGGADAIVLLALVLRHDLPGLLVGAAAMLAGALALMFARKQSLWKVVVAALDALSGQSLQGDIPSSSEMPVAVALAAVGLAMEVYILWLTMFG